MDELRRYRHVEFSISCSAGDKPISWSQHTTRTDEELTDYALKVGAQVCKDRGRAHVNSHRLTLTTSVTVPAAGNRG